MIVKVKFFGMGEQSAQDVEDGTQKRIRVRFIKKQGDLNQCYTMLKEMKDACMSDILLAPLSPEEQ